MASGIKSAEWVQFRNGRKLRLSGQPAQVLLLLVKKEGRPGYARGALRAMEP